MTVLPEPPAATAAGQAHPTDADRDRIRRLMAALDEIEQPTSYNDPDLPAWKDGSRIGTTPPVQQPGIPAMTNGATQTARVFMYCSWATVPPGLITIGIMVASQHTNPTVIGMICGTICATPAAVAVPILAIARLIRRAGEAVPAEIHQTYTGNIHQEVVHTETRAIWSKTTNKS